MHAVFPEKNRGSRMFIPIPMPSVVVHQIDFLRFRYAKVLGHWTSHSPDIRFHPLEIPLKSGIRDEVQSRLTASIHCQVGPRIMEFLPVVRPQASNLSEN